MFCSNCGTKINDNANFCFCCGMKLQQAVKVENTSNNGFKEEFEKIVRDEVISAYIESTDVDVEMFYRKAKHYDIDRVEVDSIFENSTNNINKLNSYIAELLEDSKEMPLSDRQLDELFRFGSTFGLTEDDCEEFFDKYISENELGEQRSLFHLILKDYAATGKIKQESISDAEQLKSITKQEIFEKYKKKICDVEEVLKEIYPCEEFFDSSTISDRIQECGFSESEAHVLILGYEKASGIYDVKINKKKKRIYERLNQKFAEKIELLGHNLILDTKYFLFEHWLKSFSGFANSFAEEMDNLDCASSEYIEELESSFESSQDVMLFSMSDWAEQLELQIPNSVLDNHAKLCEEARKIIKQIKIEYADIDRRRMAEREYREQRKNNRGRWTGGGFGIKGAISGAVKAGAMNAVGGLAHSAFNAVGNMSSDISASQNKRQSAKEISKVDEILNDLAAGCLEFLMGETLSNYPEICYGKDFIDYDKVERLLKDFRKASKSDRVSLAIELLSENPYDSAVGLEVAFTLWNELGSYDERTKVGLNTLDNLFGWSNDYSSYINGIVDRLRALDIKAEIYEEDDIKTLIEIREILELLQSVLSSNGKGNGGTELKSLIDILRKLEAKCHMNENKVEVEVFKDRKATIEEVELAVTQIEKIIDNYVSKSSDIDRDKILMDFVKRKTGIEIVVANDEVVINEPSEERVHRFCNFCGKKILRTNKFCNYCGQKLKEI